MTVHENYAKNSDSLTEPLIAKMLHKILVCEKRDGRRFSAKLVGFDDGQLFFETRDGSINIDRLDNIKTASVLQEKKQIESVV